jgi:hypothetical protein
VPLPIFEPATVFDGSGNPAPMYAIWYPEWVWGHFRRCSRPPRARGAPPVFRCFPPFLIGFDAFPTAFFAWGIDGTPYAASRRCFWPTPATFAPDHQLVLLWSLPISAHH